VVEKWFGQKFGKTLSTGDRRGKNKEIATKNLILGTKLFVVVAVVAVSDIKCIFRSSVCFS
jgi:hypothetical protein